MGKANLRTTLLIAFLLACTGPALAQQKPLADHLTPTPTATAAPAGHASSDLNFENRTDGTPALQRRDGRYRICASDVLGLTFPLTPEFNQTVNVEPDGFASLVGAPEVHLEGLTTQESVAAIQTAYAKVLLNPVVSVQLKDFNKPSFIVNGQVKSPGKFDLRGNITATQAIAIAGGFTDAAKHSQVLLFRRVGDDWYEVKRLDLKQILKGRNVNEDPEIHPGDMLVVPQNTISKIERFIPRSGVGAYYQP
ncbi:MAG: polysaccharide biosynthesis/export family protein [Candidatus Acidiferrales bacterium]